MITDRYPWSQNATANEPLVALGISVPERTCELPPQLGTLFQGRTSNCSRAEASEGRQIGFTSPVIGLRTSDWNLGSLAFSVESTRIDTVHEHSKTARKHGLTHINTGIFFRRSGRSFFEILTVLSERPSTRFAVLVLGRILQCLHAARASSQFGPPDMHIAKTAAPLLFLLITTHAEDPCPSLNCLQTSPVLRGLVRNELANPRTPAEQTLTRCICAMVPRRTEHKEYLARGRFEQPDRTKQPAWTHPVLANGKMFIRDQDALFCFDVTAKP
jgi:hypothetical protein